MRWFITIAPQKIWNVNKYKNADNSIQGGGTNKQKQTQVHLIIINPNLRTVMKGNDINNQN